MAVTVEKLKIDLVFDTKTLRRELGMVSKDFDKVGGSAAILKTALTGLAVGATAAFAAITTSLKKTADAGSELVDIRDRTGIAVESLSAMKYALGQTGSSLGDFEIAVKKMQKSLVDSSPKFAEIGLSADSLRAMKPEEQFLAIADAISKLGDPAEQTAAALEIFGKSGTSLLPLMQDGAAGVRELMDEAVRLGLVMSTESAEAAEAFGDNLQKVFDVGERLVVQLGSALLPMINDVMFDLVNWATLMQRAWTNAALSVVQAYNSIAGIVGLEASALEETLTEMAAEFDEKLRQARAELEKPVKAKVEVTTTTVGKGGKGGDFGATGDFGDTKSTGSLADLSKSNKAARDSFVKGPLGELTSKAGPFAGLAKGLGEALGGPVVSALSPLGDAAASLSPENLGIDKIFEPEKEKPDEKPGTDNAALEFGSAGALSAIAKFRNDALSGGKTPEKQLKEAELTNEKLDLIADALSGLGGLVMAEL